MFIRAAFVLAGLLILGAASPTLAQDSTPSASPTSGEPDIHMVLVERSDHVTNIDLGDAGPSVGDQIIWGPDPLYDETNTTDTGATTQGICTAFTATADCLLLETIVFSNGSTLELQGVQPGQPIESVRTIVAGSGVYLGAQGTATVSPTEDLLFWTKTLDIWLAS